MGWGLELGQGYRGRGRGRVSRAACRPVGPRAGRGWRWRLGVITRKRTARPSGTLWIAMAMARGRPEVTEW